MLSFHLNSVMLCLGRAVLPTPELVNCYYLRNALSLGRHRVLDLYKTASVSIELRLLFLSSSPRASHPHCTSMFTIPAIPPLFHCILLWGLVPALRMAIERLLRQAFGVEELRHPETIVVVVFVARWLTDFIVDTVRTVIEFIYLAP
ncbi:hypothetical protein Landi51_12349 [Colletotrichum acutatum]